MQVNVSKMQANAGNILGKNRSYMGPLCCCLAAQWMKKSYVSLLISVLKLE